MKKICNYRPLVFVLLIMMLAISIISWSYANLIVFSIFTTIGIVVIFVFGACKKCRKYLLIPIFFVLSLILCFTTFQVFNAKKVNYKNASIKAVVLENHTNYAILDNIYVGNKKLNGKAILFFEKDNSELKNGDFINYYSEISSIKLDMSDSYSISNFNDKIFYKTTVENYKILNAKKLPINEKIKLKVYNNLFDNLRNDSASICYALLFGNSKYMSKNVKNAFSATGLAHIFAVSGLHIGILAGFLYFLFKKLKIKNWINFLNLLIILILYNLLCGYSPSMVRATVMILVFIIADINGFKKDSLSTLAFSGILILLYSPLSLFDLGFQMSFMAVLGIIIFKRPLNKIFKFLPKNLNDLISISLACNIMLFPIICKYFESFPVLFLLSNVLVLPFIPLVYILLLFFTILSLIFPIGVILCVFDYILIPIKALTIFVNNYNLTLKPLYLSGFNVGYYGLIFTNNRYMFINKKIKITISIILILISLILCVI